MKDYIIMGLIVVNIALVIYLYFKSKRDVNLENDINSKMEANITERLGRFEVNINKEINEFEKAFVKDMDKDFEKLNTNVEERLMQINEKVNNRLDQNFEKTNKTFNNILERLTKIDEAQKKIDSLSNDIVSLQSILTDKKTRGIYGEVNLKQVLASVFGENNNKVYELQYTLPNNTIADSILFAPAPLGTIVIDSKFPLENYRMMVDKKIPAELRERYVKQFKADVKKHIPDVTTNQAIMFLPAEAIFAEINAYHPDLIDYSYKKRVWIVSPTTLMSTLTVIQMIIKNIERDKYTTIIHSELNKLGLEFNRYKDRWDKLARSVQTVNKDIMDVQITSDKISKKFEYISGVDIDKLEQK